MRIIYGKYGRRRFDKKLPPGVRPTLDAAREALFNSLTNIIEFQGISVLDLCSGTGAMGIEALSRGAGSCTFVDASVKSLNFTKEFLAYLKVPETDYTISKYDALKYIKKLDETAKFDLILCDPPYNLDILNDILDEVSKRQILNVGGIIAVEYEPKYNIVIPELFKEVYRYSGGSTTLLTLSI
jgi:16S rRNA (guanine966-N2)-methyltransferase